MGFSPTKPNQDSSAQPIGGARRRKAVATLFTGVGLGATGYLAVISVTVLVAEDMLGSTTWSGLPAAVSIVGRAVGSALLSILMARRGRRLGLILGYAIGTAAAGTAAVATILSSFWLLLLAMFLVGFGYGSNFLARYAAADLYPAEQRASAIGWIVWAGTVGAVLGPILLEPAHAFAITLGVVGFAGPYIISVVANTAAITVISLGLPRQQPPSIEAGSLGGTPSGNSVLQVLSTPGIQLALVAMALAQVVMVLIMTMTPVHIRNGGEGLASVGLVMSAHVVGMYAFAPLPGWLSDKFGKIPVLLAGSALLALSGLVAAANSGGQTFWLAVGLLLLGLGWSFSFVAGSALLTENIPEASRVRFQGFADSLVWTTAAAASLSSGFLLAGWGYAFLSLAGAVIALVPVLAVARYRWRAAPAA